MKQIDEIRLKLRELCPHEYLLNKHTEDISILCPKVISPEVIIAVDIPEKKNLNEKN